MLSLNEFFYAVSHLYGYIIFATILAPLVAIIKSKVSGWEKDGWKMTKKEIVIWAVSGFFLSTLIILFLPALNSFAYQ